MSLPPANDDAFVISRSKKSLCLATASLPHLSGLARRLRLKVTREVPVAAIGSSGLLLLNPEVFGKIPLGDAAFVLAHEMLHLALDTHGRLGDADPLIVNYAHDYIINDMLSTELEREPPLNGLSLAGARQKSMEEMVVELSRRGSGTNDMHCWSQSNARGQGGERSTRSPLSRALEDAGLVEPPPPPRKIRRGDVLSDNDECRLEPELTPQMRQTLREIIRREAAKAASLCELRDKIEQAGVSSEFSEPQRGSTMMEALRAAYETPWELALQRWLDAVGPGERTYARPSRRSGLRSDVVLPGRRREGWTLHILLDTSGSMYEVIPRALGAIAYFCEASGIADVHLLQCDIEVTDDRWIEPQNMAEYQIAGFGGSDMGPGLLHLANDPDVSSVLVLTDGYIEIPAEAPPYVVLWCLIGESYRSFSPSYGQVVRMELD